ncbi:MAG TPA: hypothetical protein VMR37_00225 [Rhabdochlamydiaceae bacterium]|nr:hypothetical protein [Rhabdochlamydiaceae bacterium]
MTLEGISDGLESTNPHPAFTDKSTEWNGKDVRILPTISGAWLVLKIPVDPQSAPTSLGEKVTSVNSKPLPTVEQVLERHNLKFAPSTWGQREVEKLPTTGHGWVIIPLQTSAPSLEGKVTIDANDHRNIEKVLERNGFWFSSPETPDYFTMQSWV